MNNIIIGSVNQSLKKLNLNVVSLIQQNQENIDLESYFKDSASEHYSVDNQHAFIKNSITEFPESLASEVEQLDFNYKMGFLPTINNMWLSTGTSLFLWNYVDKTDLFKYECSETIENIEVIKLLTHHELVVSTCNNIHLHGISREGDKGKLKIISTVNVTVDGVVMSNFITTNDTKRLFMQGNDGHVYELDVRTNTDGLIRSCAIICRTANPLMKYLPALFKSVPEVPVKSMVVDDKKKLLYILLNDSSIHSVNINGGCYLPIQRYTSSNLESIHLIPSTESKHINLMAVTNKGDRLYFACKDKGIDLIHTRPAPPLPGSLLFNSLKKEACDLSFYNHGVSAAVLAKSERKYLVLYSANLVRDINLKLIFVEDVYIDYLEKKIWSIIESSPSVSLTNHYLKETLELPESSARQFSALSESGITHYTKQRPVDYLAEILSNNNQTGILAFTGRYGVVETCALAFSLACSSKQSPEVVDFLRRVDVKDDSLLLYFSRIVEKIWTVDIMQSDMSSISQDERKTVQTRLRILLRFIYQADIKVEKGLVDLITRTIEGISLICFAHNQEWEEIRASLFFIITSCSFADLVTTEEGALLAKEMVLTIIKTSKLSNSTNGYNFVSGFLSNNCPAFLGENNITCYKGLECLQGALSDPNNKTALGLSLNHFQTIIHLLDLGTLQPLCHEYCKLEYHIGAIKLAYAKHQAGSSPNPKIYEIIFASIEDALTNTQEKAHGKYVIENALELTNEERYHYQIYKWMFDNDQRDLLVTLNTPLLAKYIKTQLPFNESLDCLHHYYAHRNEYAMAIICLSELATKSQDMTLEKRVKYLQVAIEYLPQTNISEAEKIDLKTTYKEANIQLDLYKTLTKSDNVKAKLAAAGLGTTLKPAVVLLREFAYTHSLYEEALRLMDLMELYDWNYVKDAWVHIVDKCKTEEELESKIHDLCQILYPSIASFPVYLVYKVLEEHCSSYSNDFARKALLQAGIPEDVIIDAKAATAC